MKSLPLVIACAAALVAANTPARETAAQQLGEYYQPGIPSIVKAFIGARVIDGTDRAPIPNAVIIVRDGRVVGAGPLGRVPIPPTAERITLTGKTVIPGLVNAHGHAGNTTGMEQAH